jgi:hypothetical protein
MNLSSSFRRTALLQAFVMTLASIHPSVVMAFDFSFFSLQSSNTTEMLERHAAADYFQNHPSDARRLARIAQAVRSESLTRNGVNDFLKDPLAGTKCYISCDAAYAASLQWTVDNWKTATAEDKSVTGVYVGGKTRESYPALDRGLSAGSTLMGMAGGGGPGGVLSLTKEFYPYLTREIAPKYKATPEEVVTDLAYGFAQVRKGTMEGKALGGVYEEIGNFQVKNPIEQWPSSKAAIAESNALKAQGSSEKALLSIHGVRESLATLKDNIADMRAQVNDLYRQSLWESQQRRLEAQRLAQAQAVSQNLQAAEGALAAAATLLDMAGDHKAARSAMALANAIDKTEKVAT